MGLLGLRRLLGLLKTVESQSQNVSLHYEVSSVNDKKCVGVGNFLHKSQKHGKMKKTTLHLEAKVDGNA